jgi:riboflavin synthase
MFTGLVQDLGTVAELHETSDGVRIAVESPLAAELKDGDSIAVNGVCLTAVGHVRGERFGADVMRETLRRSSLGAVAEGRRSTSSCRCAPPTASAATSCRATSTVSASWPQRATRASPASSPSRPSRRCCATSSRRARSPSTGSRSPVARVDEQGFDVSLIPETLERTTLGRADVGTIVNLEADVLAKHVEKLLAHRD